MIHTKHPKALPYLFLTELWERFGFYIAQGLLVLYLTNFFGFSDSISFEILGIFSALAYIAPLIGGFLANKVLGYKTSIIMGSFFLFLGYAMLALSEVKIFLFPALATIVVGNGLFKPNISSLLGTQYGEQDPRRESGFIIFYIGINLGALLAGLCSGYIKDYFGWKMSFAAASAGLIIGLLTFLSGSSAYNQTSTNQIADLKLKTLTFFYCVIGIVGVSFMITMYQLATWILPIAGVGILIVLFIFTFTQQGETRARMIALDILILSSIIFWMLFFQMFYSANLFVERLVDKNIFGFHLSTTIFWGSESVFIILLGPLFVMLWNRLANKNIQPSPILKFAIGLLFAGLGFVVLAFSTYYPNHEGLIYPHWIFIAYLLITIGELLLSPIGLSAVSNLAPSHLIGLLMGIWFVGTGYGNLFAGLIAHLADIPKDIHLIADKMLIYQHAFFNYAYLAFITAIVLYFVHLAVKKIFDINLAGQS